MFTPDCRPILIGSLPLTDHLEALQLMYRFAPEVPLWLQLPRRPKEGMVRQFLDGFPGLVDEGGRFFVATDDPGFPSQMVSFYEEYFQAKEDGAAVATSRFALTDETAPGFAVFVKALRQSRIPQPIAVKGQITGPVTCGIGLKDRMGNAVFYDDNLRDILIKLLGLKARWQVRHLQQAAGGMPVILFIDEPGLVSFGSSGFAGVSREMASAAVAEVMAAIRDAGACAGLHICANGDWGPPLASATDIISFDAYSYFANFILFRRELIAYLHRGGMLAWGIVPTGDPQAITDASAANLFAQWRDQVQTLAGFGIDEKALLHRTFIAPSCGTGSLTIELAEKVLAMTAEVSRLARQYLSRL